MKRYTFYINMLFICIILLCHTGCRTPKGKLVKKHPPIIFPSLQATPLDEGILFPVYKDGKTGIYKVTIADSSVNTFIYPQPGLLSNPLLSSDRKNIFFTWSYKEKDKYRDYICIFNLDSSKLTKKLPIDRIVTSLSLSKNKDELYVSLANEIAKSSVISNTKPRIMDIYSFSLISGHYTRTTFLNTYSINDHIRIDDSKENIYINASFYSHNLKNGPYTYNIDSKKTKSLIPYNIEHMHIYINENILNRDFYSQFFFPIPLHNSNYLFLQGAHAIYKLNTSTMEGRILFQPPRATGIKTAYIIRGAALFNNSNNLAIYQKGPCGDNFLIIKENGQTINLPINTDQFINDF